MRVPIKKLFKAIFVGSEDLSPMMDYKVKDINLANEGKKMVKLAESNMPVLKMLKDKYSFNQPFSGLKIGGAIHVTKETAVLINAIQELGAEVAWAGCNPLSTNDKVAAYLASIGVNIYAWRNNHKEYYWCMDQVIRHKPDLTMDDGGDLVFRIHKEYPHLLEDIIGGTEETTTGVHRLEAMAADKKLRYPVIAVNNAETKWDFDNVYGTAQGTIDGILRATSTLIAGKTFVVAGYGHCGKGIAKRALGMGAKVVVTEVDPVNALRAKMEGYDVMEMAKAAKIGDIFVTATGNKDIILAKHFKKMKNGAILANAGHFNVEIDVNSLELIAKEKEEVRPNLMRYKVGSKNIYLIAEGRLVNLSAAEGHPSEVMDLSFSNQLMSLIQLVEHYGELEDMVYGVPKEQDNEIAALKLKAMGVKIDSLSGEQKSYINSYEEGTK